MKKPKKKKVIATKAKASAKGHTKSSMGQPYGDRVLVKPAPVEETTSFGIIIPDSGKEKPEQGVVVAVGPGRRGEDGRVVPVGVAVGDRIMFSKYGVEEVTINGTEYYLIREDSITYVF